MKRLILQLGSNNWQRGEEFAPGSGILHEAHHNAYNSLNDTRCYSIYPSKKQTSDRRDVRIFSLEHDIPICESISPVSSYRFHSMSESEFQEYRDRLEGFVIDYMDRVEDYEGKEIDVFIAHHSFLNPLIMRDVIRKRIETGRSKPLLVCFVHGTALKMFAHERSEEKPEEYPSRFLPMMQREKVFDYVYGQSVDLCVAISKQQVDALCDVFPEFPRDRVIVSPNGYNQNAFKILGEVHKNRNQVLSGFETTAPRITAAARSLKGCNFDKVVIFCGKFADWKRLDAVLYAAQIYENQSLKIATLVAGSGPLEDQKRYQRLAYETLGLEHAYFLGPRSQDELTVLFNTADIGCFPSKNEPFGLVLLECMACGTPAIGANSGGPRDFVNDEVGSLVPESDKIEDLSVALAKKILQSFSEDWKDRKGKAAAEYALDNFGVERQCRNLLREIDRRN